MAQLGRRARQRRTRELILGTLGFIAVAAIVLGGLYYAKSRPKSLDKESLCPANGPTGHYVLLVDRTDPLSFTQMEAFKVTLRELVEKRTAEGYLLSVFVLGADFKEGAKPIAELCNPGSGQNKSDLTENVRQLKKQYQERFLDPLLKQSDALLATEPAKFSPILEMMQLVAINGFRKHNVKGPRRLIVMSDMLQNTPQYSMYKGTPDYSTFASSSYGQKAQLELHGVEVEVHYLMNSPQLQTKRNLKFWEDYFDKAGARIVAVRPLEG
jgi:hypothetical protein